MLSEWSSKIIFLQAKNYSKLWSAFFWGFYRL